jgi:RHS repeat-associated protein
MRIPLVGYTTTAAVLWDDVNIVGEMSCTSGTRMSYYPYGQEIGTTANDTVKFGTYTRDAATGLDYAMNRYYQSTWGRFTSPDPYRTSGGPEDPGSWNRYAYVLGIR